MRGRNGVKKAREISRCDDVRRQRAIRMAATMKTALIYLQAFDGSFWIAE